jgi:hypothetical protein
MRTDGSHWPRRLRRAGDLFEDATETEYLRQQTVKPKGSEKALS